MSEPLVRAELTKLARVLGTSEAEVGFLVPLGAAGLRRLGSRVSRLLFDDHRPVLQKLADAGRLLPATLVAKLSELVFGPMLSARIAGLMPPPRAVEVAQKLHAKFLADVCIELDPRSASELLALMPVKIVVEVSRQLLGRGEHMTMGRFVDDLTDQAVRAVADDITDDAALVRIGYFVERRERLNELVGLLDASRIRRLVAAVVAGPAELQQAGLAMMSQLTHKQQARFGDAAAALGPEALATLAAAASAAGFGQELAALGL